MIHLLSPLTTHFIFWDLQPSYGRVSSFCCIFVYVFVWKLKTSLTLILTLKLKWYYRSVEDHQFVDDICRVGHHVRRQTEDTSLVDCLHQRLAMLIQETLDKRLTHLKIFLRLRERNNSYVIIMMKLLSHQAF